MIRKILPAVIAAMTMQAFEAQAYQHPCLLHSQTDIEYVKQNLDITPWNKAYSHLQSSSYAQASYSESTSALLDGYLKRMDQKNWSGVYDDYSNYTALMKDAAAAYQLALRYTLSGDTHYADAAIAILNAWAANCKGFLKLEGKGYNNDIPDPNEYLMLIQGHQLANAAELLRDYTGWSSTDFETFRTWMTSTFADIAYLFLTNHHGGQGKNHYWLNWDLAAMTALLSTAILCDDTEKADFVIDYFKNTDTELGCITRAVPYIYNDDETGETIGQCEESGRDQGHTTLCVALMGTLCQTALNIGEDLFAYDDYRAVAMAEYVAKYNLMTETAFSNYSNTQTSEEESDYQYSSSTFPYTAYTHESTECNTISTTGRGTRRPCWELFAGYAKAKGISAEYSTRMAQLQSDYNGFGDGGAGDYGSTSGGFDQLGYGTLMYYRTDIESDGQARNDTYVRNDAPAKNYGSLTTMEMKKYTDSSDETYGGKFYNALISFAIPEAVAKYKDLVTVNSATMTLVTRKAEARDNINIYAYGHAFDQSTATYNTEKEYTGAATELITSFEIQTPTTARSLDDKGQKADAYTLSKWTNTIDLTDYVSNFTGTVMPLMMTPATDQNKAIKIFASEAADISVLDSDGNTVEISASDITPRLDIDYSVAYALTVSDAEMATLCLPFTASIPDGASAYTLTYSGGDYAKATALSGEIPANTPVLIRAEAGTYTFKATNNTISPADSPASGALTGVYETTAVPEGAYILQSYDKGNGFYIANNSTVNAYHAYLTAEAGAKAIRILFDDATGISSVKANANDNAIYTLQGVKLNNATQKGAYIKGGKKYILR